MRSIFFLLIALILLAGCGKKGALIPPEALAPAEVENLRVLQKGDSFVILWQAPSKEQGGRPLRDLSGFQLLRHDILPGAPDCAACPDTWKLLTAFDLENPKGLRQNDGAFIYEDREIKPGAGSLYRVTAHSKSGGTSRPTTSPARRKVAPPLSPRLTAKASPATIRLELSPSDNSAVPVGFNVYRNLAGSEPSFFPLNPEPVIQSSFEDQRIEYGRVYRYSATSLVITEGELVESRPSEEVEIRFSLPEIH